MDSVSKTDGLNVTTQIGLEVYKAAFEAWRYEVDS